MNAIQNQDPESPVIYLQTAIKKHQSIFEQVLAKPKEMLQAIFQQALRDLSARLSSIIVWKGCMFESCHYWNFRILDAHGFQEAFFQEFEKLDTLDIKFPTTANEIFDLLEKPDWTIADYARNYLFLKQEQSKKLDEKSLKVLAAAFYLFDAIEKTHLLSSSLPFWIAKGPNQITFEHEVIYSCVKFQSKSQEITLFLRGEETKQIEIHIKNKGKSTALPALSFKNEDQVINQLLAIDEVLSTWEQTRGSLHFTGIETQEEFSLAFFLLQFMEEFRSQILSKEKKLLSTTFFLIPLTYTCFIKSHPNLEISTANYRFLYALLKKLLPELGKRYNFFIPEALKDVRKEDIALVAQQFEDFATSIYRFLANEKDIESDPPLKVSIIKQEMVEGEPPLFYVSIDATQCTLFKKGEELEEEDEETVKEEIRKRFNNFLQALKQWAEICGVQVILKEVKLAHTDASLRAVGALAEEVEVINLSRTGQKISLGYLNGFPLLMELNVDGCPKECFTEFLPHISIPDAFVPQFLDLKLQNIKPSSIKKLSMTHIDIEKNRAFWLFIEKMFPKLESLTLSVKPGEKILGLNDAVTLSSVVNGKILPCGHVFSVASILKMKECAIDRKEFKKQDLLDFKPAKVHFYKKDGKWFASLAESSGKELEEKDSLSFYHECGEIIREDSLKKDYRIQTGLAANETYEKLLQCTCLACDKPFSAETLTKIYLNSLGGTALEEGFESFSEVSNYFSRKNLK